MRPLGMSQKCQELTFASTWLGWFTLCRPTLTKYSPWYADYGRAMGGIYSSRCPAYWGRSLRANVVTGLEHDRRCRRIEAHADRVRPSRYRLDLFLEHAADHQDAAI
jgi:hypothetical protein